MGARVNSFAARMREQFRALGDGGGEVRLADLAERLDLVSDKDKAPMYTALKDFIRRGEIRRVRPGAYVTTGAQDPPIEVRRKMWKVLRARRSVTVEDLMELTGASRSYAQEFLRVMAAREVVVRGEGPRPLWRLVQDVVRMPEDDAKAARLRELRRRQKLKELGAALNAVSIATETARRLLAEAEAE